MKLVGKRNAFFGSLLLLLVFLIGTILLILGMGNTPEFIIFSTVLFAIGCVVPVNEGFVQALGNLPEAKGKISALINTLKWILTMVGVQTASYFYHGSYSPIGITLFIMILISLLLMLVTYKNDANFKNALNVSPLVD